MYASRRKREHCGEGCVGRCVKPSQGSPLERLHLDCRAAPVGKRPVHATKFAKSQTTCGGGGVESNGGGFQSFLGRGRELVTKNVGAPSLMAKVVQRARCTE